MEDNVLQIKKADAVTAFRSGSDADKKLLKNLFPGQFGSLTERIKTWEDVVNELGVEDEDDLLPDVQKPLFSMERQIHAHAKLLLITDLFREGWVPDWSNGSQYKYFPYFEHKSGVGLSFHDDVFVSSFTGVAARLCLPTADLARYVGRTFESIYRDYLTY